MTNPYKKALGDRKTSKKAEPEMVELSPSTQPEPATPAIAPEPVVTAQPSAPAPKKRGRPATGKRSADGWIGRTFYVREETDLDVEEWLLKLKRRGVDVDKSELVEMLLSAWVKWQQGENLEFQLDEISPIQKFKS